MQQPLNQFGLRRSGLHAICGWLLHHHEGLKHVNDCRCPPPAEFADAPYTVFEDDPVPVIRSYVQQTATTHNSIIVLRDPYNWWASRCRHGCPWLSKKHPNPQPDEPGGTNWREARRLMWIGYAHQCWKELWPAPAFWISYNRWFVDGQYRRAIATQLGFDTDGSPWQGVMGAGGGSSFDLRNFNGKAQDMAVLERWRECVDLPLWRNGMTEEMVFYARELFGMPAPW